MTVEVKAKRVVLGFFIMLAGLALWVILVWRQMMGNMLEQMMGHRAIRLGREVKFVILFVHFHFMNKWLHGPVFSSLKPARIAFYLPYAWFTLTFNYSYGQEPGFVAGMTFSMVVVAGNALMYLVCSEVADRARFIYVDDREVCYMLLYCHFPKFRM